MPHSSKWAYCHLFYAPPVHVRSSVLQVSPESEGVHSSLLSHRCVEGEGVHEAGEGRREGKGRNGKRGEKWGGKGRKKGKEWKMRGEVELNLVKQVG